MSKEAKTLMHFAACIRSGTNSDEYAYCMTAARRWAAWILAGEA